MGSANGDQDTENTELMAIYTKENQITEKVICRTESRLSCLQNADVCCKTAVMSFSYNPRVISNI